jgi:hypothetical protein
MAGWLVLTYANDAQEKFESPGESRIEVATYGSPQARSFAELGVVSAEWFAEEPEVKGKTPNEVAEEEAAKAAEEAAASEEQTTKAKASSK